MKSFALFDQTAGNNDILLFYNDKKLLNFLFFLESEHHSLFWCISIILSTSAIQFSPFLGW